jgi:hypothetical protein
MSIERRKNRDYWTARPRFLTMLPSIYTRKCFEWRWWILFVNKTALFTCTPIAVEKRDLCRPGRAWKNRCVLFRRACLISIEKENVTFDGLPLWRHLSATIDVQLVHFTWWIKNRSRRKRKRHMGHWKRRRRGKSNCNTNEPIDRGMRSSFSKAVLSARFSL